MADSLDPPITDEVRGLSTPKGARAVANRDVAAKRDPEKNVSLGNVVEAVPGRQFRAFGLDVGKDTFEKAGVGENFRRIRNAYDEAPGSQVIIRGSQSPSVRTGPNDADLADRRARSAKALLVKEGIPESAIRIEAAPAAHLDPRAISPEQKATMRGASIELIPPPPIRRPDTGFTDQPSLVVDKPWPNIRLPNIADLPKPPNLGPLVRRLLSAPLQKAQDDFDRGIRKATGVLVGSGIAIALLPELAEAMGLELALHFLPELIEAAAQEYGKDKVAKYVKEKLKKRLKDRANERDRKEETRFMAEMLRRIIAGGLSEKGPHHPLYFLVNPKTRNWKARRPGTPFAVQPGHTLSHSAYGFAFALEDAESNQRFRGDKIETPGGFGFSVAYKIDDVYIDRGTAQRYESQGYLPAGTSAKAPFSVGWIDF